MSRRAAAPPPVGAIGEALQRLQAHTRGAAEAAQEVGHEASSWLRTEAQRRPLATLGLTLACGFVAGAGLPPRLRAVLLGLAGKAAVQALKFSSPPSPHSFEEKA